MGRDTLAPFLGLDWTPVTVAAITLAGVVFTALINLRVARLLRTPSKRHIGEQVEDAHHLAIANRHLLVRLAHAYGIKADDPELRAILGDGGDVE